MTKGEPSMQKALRKGLFSQQRIMFLALFIVGLLIGLYLEHTFIEPAISNDTNERIALLSAKNNLQTEQIQVYAQCLQKNNVELASCENLSG